MPDNATKRDAQLSTTSWASHCVQLGISEKGSKRGRTIAKKALSLHQIIYQHQNERICTESAG